MYFHRCCALSVRLTVELKTLVAYTRLSSIVVFRNKIATGALALPLTLFQYSKEKIPK